MISVRGGCSRQLQGHRRVHRRRRSSGTSRRSASPGVPAGAAAAQRHRRTRRASRSPTTTDQAPASSRSTTTSRSRPAARTSSRVDSAFVTPPMTWTRRYPGGYVLLYWGLTLRAARRHRRRHGYLRLLRSQRPRHPRHGQREHALALRPGHVAVSNRLSLNLGVRTEKRNRSVVPPRHQGDGVRRSASATRSRRASARPTTCSATAR